MTPSLLVCFFATTCAILSACSPPHAVRIQLDNTWSPQDRLQVYLRRTAENSGTFSETDFIIDANEHSGTELVVMLDNGEGVLDVSVSKIDSNNCKLKCATKSGVDIISTGSVTDVPLRDSTECFIPWPARCDCYLGWCNTKVISEVSFNGNYIAVTGVRDTEQSDKNAPYRIWAVGGDHPGLFELLKSEHQSDSLNQNRVPVLNQSNLDDNEVRLRSLVIGKEGGKNFVWAISQKGVYRKEVTSRGKGLWPWNNVMGDLDLKKIAAGYDVDSNNDKINITGSIDKKGALLHYDGSRWPNILDENMKIDVKNKSMNGLWLGRKNRRAVIVGELGIVIKRSVDPFTLEDKSEAMVTTKTLNTVTCIDTESTQCWAAGNEGSVCSLMERNLEAIPKNDIIKSRNNESSLADVTLYSSLSMKKENSEKPIVWMVGDKATVLFFNGKVWRWLQVRNRAVDERGGDGKSIELSKIVYRDIWAADEQNVWIVGSGGQMRVIDPTIPL